MNHAGNLTPEDRENLTAYLDGELDETSAQTLGAKLTQNPAARQEAEALQRAWDMLDFLPRPQAPEEFAHQTVEQMSIQRVDQLAGRRRWKRLAYAGWVLAAAATIVIGFKLTYQPAPSPDEQRILRYLPYYERIDDMEFLHELAQPDLFGEES